MSNYYNEHHFKFNLPIYRNGIGYSQFDLKIDGAELNGITSINVRANAGSITTVSLDIEASSAIECVGALIANVNISDRETRLAGVLDAACHDSGVSFAGALDRAAKAEFIKRVIEIAIENIK